ncbi:MAG: spore cortex biosynthesis protein YabQ, partial [Bacillota bacterium]
MPALEFHLYSFLTLVLTGVAAGLAFDVLRAVRRRLRPGRPVAPLLDLAYGVALGGFLGAGLFLANRGELRLYVFLGVATGAAL